MFSRNTSGLVQNPCKIDFYLTFLNGIEQHNGRQARAARAAFALGLSLQVKLSSNLTASPRLRQLTGRASADNVHSTKNESPVLPPLPHGYENIILVLRKERDSS